MADETEIIGRLLPDKVLVGKTQTATSEIIGELPKDKELIGVLEDVN